LAIDLETIGHTWEGSDGSTPNGRVIFTHSSQTDGATEATTVSTQPILSELVAGVLSQGLVPNVNDDLSPDGTFYWVREEIVGSTPVSYPITVPTGGPFDLWTLRQAS
jgi:hypothetical protein